MFARTYAPDKMSETVKTWKADLQAKKRGKLAASIADPSENPELFEETRHEAAAPVAEEPEKTQNAPAVPEG